MNADKDANAVHDKVFKLLPWWINDTLSSTERALVDTHIENCFTCRQESSLLQATFKASLTVPMAVPDVHSSLAQSLHRIQSETQSNIHHTPSLINHLKNLADWLQWRFNCLSNNRMTVAATGFAIIFVALISLQQRPTVLNDDYNVLSSPIVAVEPTRLSINFTADISRAQAEAVLQDAVPGLLSSAELQYVAGKQYILTLPATNSIQQISNLVSDLQDLSEISRVDMNAPD